jgi:hypothetical protein
MSGRVIPWLLFEFQRVSSLRVVAQRAALFRRLSGCQLNPVKTDLHELTVLYVQILTIGIHIYLLSGGLWKNHPHKWLILLDTTMLALSFRVGNFLPTSYK